MEGGDMDFYVTEYLIRERINDARTRALAAACLAEANRRRSPNRGAARFRDLGREIVSRIRKLMGEISHAMPGRTRIAKHS
jgi:hypothetical protein